MAACGMYIVSKDRTPRSSAACAARSLSVRSWTPGLISDIHRPVVNNAALAAGGGYAIGTGHADSFVGGLAGGIVGLQIGNGIQSYFNDGISNQNPQECIRAGTGPEGNENWEVLGIMTTDAN